jgi:hypothetical protein
MDVLTGGWALSLIAYPVISGIQSAVWYGIRHTGLWTARKLIESNLDSHSLHNSNDHMSSGSLFLLHIMMNTFLKSGFELFSNIQSKRRLVSGESSHPLPAQNTTKLNNSSTERTNTDASKKEDQNYLGIVVLLSIIGWMVHNTGKKEIEEYMSRNQDVDEIKDLKQCFDEIKNIVNNETNISKRYSIFGNIVQTLYKSGSEENNNDNHANSLTRVIRVVINVLVGFILWTQKMTAFPLNVLRNQEWNNHKKEEDEDNTKSRLKKLPAAFITLDIVFLIELLLLILKIHKYSPSYNIIRVLSNMLFLKESPTIYIDELKTLSPKSIYLDPVENERILHNPWIKHNKT